MATNDRHLAEHGARLAGELGQVMPDEAEGEVARVYAEVRDVLRVPFVNSLFRVLANRPSWLPAAWDAVAPVAGTEAFEQAAERLRALAAPGDPPAVGLAERVGTEDQHALRAYTASIAYVLPKLLLIASGWAAALAGRAPAALSAGAPCERGPRPGTLNVGMADPGSLDDDTRQLLDEIADRHGHPAPATWFRGLARWPAVLAGAWAVIERDLERQERSERRDRVLAAAEEEAAALGLGAGVPDGGADRDDLAALVAVFRTRMVPDLLLDTTLVLPALMAGHDR